MMKIMKIEDVDSVRIKLSTTRVKDVEANREHQRMRSTPPCLCYRCVCPWYSLRTNAVSIGWYVCGVKVKSGERQGALTVEKAKKTTTKGANVFALQIDVCCCLLVLRCVPFCWLGGWDARGQSGSVQEILMKGWNDKCR